ncbi:MAG: DEAD/DEAH box helicase family protein [Selenomonadaceae bacterium]|nr:DEAD/DEAH box helicase family protein [Selenomonadaceae bacterium]
MKEIELRSYQKDFIDDVRHEFTHGNKRVVGVAPWGAGKTIMTGWMIRESLAKGKRSIFFVHRNELIEQTAKTFDDLHIPYGIISADEDMHLDEPVQIASVQTLARRLDLIPAPDFLICDECHHILANSYKKIIDKFPNAFLLGITATPQRKGGITLCDVFQSMVESISVDELIQRGNLTPFKYFAPEIGVNLDGVREKFGEFVTDDIAAVMEDNKIIGGIVEHYKKLADGKQAICYCVNVEHSEIVAEAFNQSGIPAAHVDGNTPKFVRAELVEKFRRDEIKVLCNCNLFSEGFDVPHCQAVILARPTMSLTLYIQQAMRAMRPDPADPDKVAIIIDHVNNYKRHGLPNKPHRWTLEPNWKSDKHICPKCKKLVLFEVDAKTGNKICPKCGYVLPAHHGEPPPKFIPMTDEHEGKLLEIDTHQDEKKSATQTRIKRAFTKPEEFLSIAKRRKYKIGWVAHNALEFAQSYEDCLHIAEICGYKSGWAWYQWQKLKAE